MKEEIIKLRKSKWTWKAIGIFFGISESRAFQIATGLPVILKERDKFAQRADYSCAGCGKKMNLLISVYKNRHRIFCSPECKEHVREKYCKICGKKYRSKNYVRKTSFCSNECRYKFMKGFLPEMTKKMREAKWGIDKV